MKDEAGKVINILSLVQDVTKEKNTAQALEENRQQLSLIYNSAIDPMWLIAVDGKDKFRFESINAAFVQVTGLQPAQVIGLPIEGVMPAASHQLVRDKYNEAIETGRVIDYVEVASHPAGIKIGEIRVIPIRDERGIVSKLVGIANDITEKRLLKERLDREQEERTRQVTTAAIKGGEMERAKVSRELHDNVNQVLTTVKLYTELVQEGQVDPQTILPKCVELLNETINEIRSLSKELAAPVLGEVAFEDTLTDLVNSLRETKKVAIDLSIDVGCCTIIDQELHLTLYRVVQEQFTNILKHAGAQQVLIRLFEKDNRLFLYISDDGRGFDTTKKAEGIGLTNMQSRVQLLGGSFEVVSAQGEGTLIKLALPVRIIDGVCRVRD